MKKTGEAKSFILAGGLGNQLFILTAGIYYSLKNKENVIFDRSNYVNGLPHYGSDICSLNPDVVFRNKPVRLVVYFKMISVSNRTLFRPFQILAKIVLKKMTKRSRFFDYTSPSLGYDPILESQILENPIFGYFQTYKYLEDPKVRNLIDSLHLGSVTDWFEKSSSEMLDLPTISVHIRRGDYMNLLDSFGILSFEYYISAINYILENSSTNYSRLLVFSDDINLAKQLFSQQEVSLPVQFAESAENHPEEMLMLMSQSHALVISNSSFSWWAAQMGNKSKFVVCPSKWFRGMLDPEDLIPPEWHRRESQWEL